MKRLIPWFGVGARHYYSVSQCPVHGLVKGKLRVKKSVEDNIFIVKTLKLIDREEAELIRAKHEGVKRRHKEKEKQPQTVWPEAASQNAGEKAER